MVERAPIVDLWLKAARRSGATVSYGVPSDAVDAVVADDVAKLAGISATHTYLLPQTPNGRGVADAWSAAGDEDPEDARPRVLIISGDEAAIDPSVRALAADAETVIGIGMFEESFRGLADLVLPGTSYLERDGTTVNLEGRLQRQRRAVLAPCPDTLAWLAKLAERFDVELSPHASVVFDEIGDRCFGGLSYGEIGERAVLPEGAPQLETQERGSRSEPRSRRETDLRLVTYRPLFTGPAVERTPELQFQRPDARGRAGGRRCALAPDPQRRHRHRLLERNVGRAARAHRPRPRGRDRSDRARARL